MMVLIVDDNAAVRSLIRRILKGFADEIRECANGAQAVAVCQAQSPDVVLMDVEMPELDGLAATRALHTMTPSTPVVIVSQHDEDVIRAAAFAAGACAFASKSDLAALPTLLRQILPATTVPTT